LQLHDLGRQREIHYFLLAGRYCGPPWRRRRKHEFKFGHPKSKSDYPKPKS